MKKSGSYFDNQGELHIPADVPLPKDLDLKLNPRQWLYWIIFSAENKRDDYSKWLTIFNSRSTHWRDRKKLMKAGYI